MDFDLRFESWIPFRRRSGVVDWGAPSLLTDAIDADPVVALAAPRPDFNAALAEFLIGLMTTALLPGDEDAWFERWERPPPPKEIAAALKRLPDAFRLLGDGPRFLQDFSAEDFADVKPDDIDDIEALLIGAPGDQTKKLNKDLFAKREHVRTLGRAGAAMALLTVQTFAHSRGAGYRTSMRGGGPLSTLVDPRTSKNSGPRWDPLWRMVWANIETHRQLESRGLGHRRYADAEIFPWLAPTRTSSEKENGRPTTPQDGHPLQAYFGMPWRIRLLAEARTGVCDLTGRADEVTVTQAQMLTHGVQYKAWRHPLSPYRQDKSGESLPLHGQPGGLGWTDWAALLLRKPNNQDAGSPALCVSHFASQRARRTGVQRFRLNAAGFDMDKAKACGWTTAELSALAIPPGRASEVWNVAEQLTKAADIVARATEWAVKCALFDKPADIGGDFSAVREEVRAGVEAQFYLSIERAAAEQAEEGVGIEISRSFLAPLRSAALDVFDARVPSDGIETASIRRLIAARYGLDCALRGLGNEGRKLHTALAIERPNGAAAEQQQRQKKGRSQ